MRITFLAAALEEMRHDLLDVMDAEPAWGDAVTQALDRLDPDRVAAAQMLEEFSHRARHDAGWDGANPVHSAALAESSARGALRATRAELGPDVADTLTAHVTYLQRRVDRLDVQTRLHPAPT
ncbi:MAG: hypothetical protein L0H64_21920, partial [Pseudonocardia sp.]|nr:hypothetical protein [Pseudonocardia sp.]